MTASLPTSEHTTRELADLIEKLTAQLQAGSAIDWTELEQDHPQHVAELRRLLPTLVVLADLSHSYDSSGAVSGVPTLRELGDFRIIREVGRGGMGIVYEAEQISLGRRVALKLLPLAGAIDPRHLQRFQIEARAAAGLHHPHIVPVYAVGADRGVPYLAMQFIDGRPLSDLIRERRTGATTPEDYVSSEAAIKTRSAANAAVDSATVLKSPTSRSLGDSAYFRQVAQWAIQAAEALEHAHSMGVVHRDVKPGNLLLDKTGQIWVADFGLAKLAASDEGVTVSGDMLGTLRYMSPEQADAKHDLVDHRSDVYSLGVTLYELLTLTRAFDGTDRQDILSKVSRSDPVAPRKLERHIPRDLETVVMKCLEKEPERRYGSAKELAEDLQRVLDHKPVWAKKPTRMQRAGKWSRRHPAAVRAAAVVLVLLTAGSILSTWLVWQAGLRTDRALEAETAERKRANEENRIARVRDAETTALLKFFEEQILAPARPEGQEGGLGHDVKLRQAIEAALPVVARDFSDKPFIEARLRRTIGLSFKYLGDANAAAQQFEIARTLYTKHRGPDHVDTLAVINSLANSYAALGRHDEALRLHEQTLARRRAELGTDHPDTLASENNLAISYDELGRLGDALRLRDETFQRTKARLGPDHADTLRAMNNLGISYIALGRHDEAVKLREQTLTLMITQLGPDHTNTLACRHNLAESYHAVGRYADALKLYEDTLELAQVKLPRDHEKTLLVMNNLAWLLATAGDVKFRDPARAVELAAKAAQLSTTNAAFWGTLGTARYRIGDWKQAATDLEFAIRLRGPNDCRNANENLFLAMTRWQLGDKDGARKYFDEGVVWMDSGKSRNDEARRFRAEAAELLGINDEANRRGRQTPR